MMQGDAYSVPVVIKAKDGTVITPEMATRVEITIGHLTRQWPGVITFNEDTLAWEFPLTQQQSFRLSQGKQKTQVRVAFSNGWVVGGDGTDVRVLKSESKSILSSATQQAKAANVAFGSIFAEIGAITVVLGAGLPEINESTKGQYLTSDGTEAKWADVEALPEISSATKGQYLTNDGETAEWADVDALPAMSSDTAGKMLTNDGEKAEWGDVPKEVMVVNFTQGGGNWSADKNWDDAAALIEAGGYVYAMAEGVALPFINYTAQQAIVFHTALHNASVVVYNVVIWKQDGLISVLGDPLPIVMYGEQTLTADQQAQARKNIGAGTPYDLPIADADTLGGVKPVAKTDAMTRSIGVDTDGGLYTEPGAWYVTIMQTALGSPDATADKTPQEIVAAYQAGYSIYANIVVTPDANATDAVIAPIVFGDLDSFTVVFSTVRSMRFLKDGAVAFYAMFVDGGWRVNRFELAKADDIPSALPNPKALTITIGDNVVSYDGSAARAVIIPTGGSSGGETWELINTFEVAEADAARVIKIDKDSNGNAFSLKEFAFRAVTNSTKTDGNVYGWFCVNGKGTYNSGLGGFETNFVRHPSSGAAIANDVIGRALPCGLVYDHSTGRKAVEGIAATSVTEVHEVEFAGYQYTENLLYGTFSLWGVRT